MIHFDFAYARPENLREAVEEFASAHAAGLHPVYYAGGTELLTFGRTGRIRPGVVIDVKGIPECRRLGIDGEEIVFGAALSLSEVIRANLFPLLSLAATGVADHTVRNRLTLGGNIAGQLPYREAVLPFLVAEARFRFEGPAGSRSLSASEAFDKRLLRSEEELLVEVRVQRDMAQLPFFHRRHERGGRIDYPLVSLCLARKGEEIRFAVSGAHGFPLRVHEAGSLLADPSLPAAERADRFVASLAVPIREDFRASAAYRRHLLQASIAEGLTALGG